MTTFIDPSKQRVYTQRGLIQMDKIVPSDIVYEFNTGKPLTVNWISKHLSSNLHEVEMKDGRTLIIDKGDILYNMHTFPNCICESDDIPHEYPYIPCHEYNWVNEYKPSDPYSFGTRLISGMDRSCDILYNTAYRWIPDEYFYASIHDRWKLIRGIFDTGYAQARSWGIAEDHVCLFHYNFNLINDIKELLLSVGVLSRVSNWDSEYRLDVIDAHKYSTKFFYNDGFITHMINMNMKYPKPLCELPEIIKVHNSPFTCPGHRAIMVKIQTNEPNSIIVAEHFLPILSK